MNSNEYFVEHGRLVVLLLDQVVQTLLEGVEEDRVLVDVLQEVLPRRALVGVELDLAVRVVEVQHRVEGVVIHGPRRRTVSILTSAVSRHCVRQMLPPSFQSVAHAIYVVFGRAEQFEPVQVRHVALAADDRHRRGRRCSPKLVFPAEMTPRMRLRLRSSLRNRMTCLGTRLSSPRPAAAVGGGDEHEGLVDDEVPVDAAQRDPLGRAARASRRSGGVARDAREVDEERPQDVGDRARGCRNGQTRRERVDLVGTEARPVVSSVKTTGA